jgi:hypothetical protein
MIMPIYRVIALDETDAIPLWDYMELKYLYI